MTIQMTRGLVKPAKRADEMRTAESAGVALWRRVADHLERAIADGRYPIDTRLPGEIDMAKRLACATRSARAPVSPRSSTPPAASREAASCAAESRRPSPRSPDVSRLRR